MKTYIFDLDNTLCDTKKDTNYWKYLEAEPFKDRIKKVNELYDQGHRIIIETARGTHSKTNWYLPTYKQLVSFGLKFHELRTGVKFGADHYIDDKAINSEDFFNDSENYLKKESGGKTKVILVNRVYKEASDERMVKLIDEYKFIESIPEEFKKYFPRIIFYGEKDNKAFYEMEHHELPTLRRLMLSNEIKENEVLYWVDKITGVSLELYNKQVIPTPYDYFQVMHFDRLYSRVQEIRRKDEWFNNEFSKETVIINDKEYKGILGLVKLFENDEFLDTVKPEFVGRWSHSDLHFSNVLIDRVNDTFIMIDPRGYNYCDYYYDYGKLWHSINGKYEMIAAGQFHIDERKFEFYKNEMFSLCESLKESLPNILFKYSRENKEEVIRKTEWNEVIHFISLIPFLLDFDGLNLRAKAAYYRSVILINEFCEKYKLG